MSSNFDDTVRSALQTVLQLALAHDEPLPLHLLLRPADDDMVDDDPLDPDMLGIPHNLPLYRREPMLPPLRPDALPPPAPSVLEALFLAMRRNNYPVELTTLPPLPPERPPGLSQAVYESAMREAGIRLPAYAPSIPTNRRLESDLPHFRKELADLEAHEASK